MFGFVRDLMLIGLVGNAVAKVVRIHCGTDFVKEMAVGRQNKIAEETIKFVEQVRGGKIKEIDESNYVDLMITGFLMLANEMGAEQAVNRQMVLMGLMAYMRYVLEKDAEISETVLSMAMTYLERYRMP